MTLPILELGDDPFERGVAHGRFMGAKIAETLEIYLRRFEAGGISREAAAVEGRAWVDFMADDNPEYFREMEGVAEGCGLPLGDIAVLNARYEITYGVFSSEARLAEGRMEEPDGCTSFGLMPAVTAHGGTLIGQNWDWLDGLRGRTFIMRVRRKEKPDFIGYAEAGIVGCKMAINEAGIGLCINGLVTAEDGQNRYRKPVHVRCRETIDADRMDLAIYPFLNTSRVCSTNVLIGQAEGEILNFELSPNAHQVLYPSDGLVVHANHMKHPSSIASRMEWIAPNTLYRDVRVERTLRAASPRIGMEAIEQALTDHYGYPAAVCRHPDPALPEARHVSTVAALVLDLDARVLHASAGTPCTHPMNAYALYPDALERSAAIA